MLKTTRLSKILIQKIFKANNNKVVKVVVNNKIDKRVKNLFNSKKLKNNKFRNLSNILNIRVTRDFTFLNFGVKETFDYLKQVFIKVLIL